MLPDWKPRLSNALMTRCLGVSLGNFAIYTENQASGGCQPPGKTGRAGGVNPPVKPGERGVSTPRWHNRRVDTPRSPADIGGAHPPLAPVCVNLYRVPYTSSPPTGFSAIILNASVGICLLCFLDLRLFIRIPPQPESASVV